MEMANLTWSNVENAGDGYMDIVEKTVFYLIDKDNIALKYKKNSKKYNDAMLELFDYYNIFIN